MMKDRIIQSLETNYIAGLCVRTSNRPGEADRDIPALWARFMAQDLAAKLPGKRSEDLYCVYTDYEKDHTQPYTALLGYQVESLDHLPEGWTGRELPAGTYEVIAVSGAVSEGAVFKTWQEIWAADRDRAYTSDFEVYHQDSPQDQPTVRIYIALYT